MSSASVSRRFILRRLIVGTAGMSSASDGRLGEVSGVVGASISRRSAKRVRILAKSFMGSSVGTAVFNVWYVSAMIVSRSRLESDSAVVYRVASADLVSSGMLLPLMDNSSTRLLKSWRYQYVSSRRVSVASMEM